MDCYSGTTTAHMSLQADTPRPGKPVSQPSQAAYDTSARLSAFTFVYIVHHHSGQQAAKEINHDHGRSLKEAVNSHHHEIATRQLTMPSMEATPTFFAPIQFIVHNHDHGHGHGHVHFSQPRIHLRLYCRPRYSFLDWTNRSSHQPRLRLRPSPFRLFSMVVEEPTRSRRYQTIRISIPFLIFASCYFPPFDYQDSHPHAPPAMTLSLNHCELPWHAWAKTQ